MDYFFLYTAFLHIAKLYICHDWILLLLCIDQFNCLQYQSKLQPRTDDIPNKPTYKANRVRGYQRYAPNRS